MREELPKVDTAVLDTLIDFKRERETLRQRLARLSEAGAHVSDAVLRRVRHDYEGRLGAIEEKAASLKEEARQAYMQLRPLQEAAQEAFETFRLDEEEIRLRHALGEFSDEEYRNRVAQLGEGKKGAEGQQAEISELVGRYLGAFDSPEDLDPSLKTHSAHLPAAVAPAGTSEDDHTWVTPPELPAESAPSGNGEAAAILEPPLESTPSLLPQGPPPPDTVEAGVVAPSEITRPHDAAELSEEAGGGGPAETAGDRPRLQALDGDIEPTEFELEPLTFVGRTPENQVRIYKPAVSRRHAQIAVTADGWLLRDLSSENGTYVNGQRVTERKLVDGDRVQFGTSRFIFKSA